MLVSAFDHYRNQQQIQARGIVAARAARRKGLTATATVVAAFQVLAARDALNGVESMIEEQGFEAPPAATVAVAAFAGTASDGRGLGSLLDQAKTDYQFGLMVATQLKDIGRMAGATSIATRPAITGYTRMLNPPSCSRCAVLAGKFYRWNTGFQRHPGCDCIHVPTRNEASAQSEGLISNPDDYFQSLSSVEQDRIFTKAGAESIRMGADISQVVNARRGMQMAGETVTAVRTVNGREMIVNLRRRQAVPSQIGGRDAYTTSEGITARGRSNNKRLGRNLDARLMPETILSAATDRDDALRLLKLNGFIF